jgi:hypothetical protein
MPCYTGGGTEQCHKNDTKGCIKSAKKVLFAGLLQVICNMPYFLMIQIVQQS